MSYILEALKKSERERKLGQVPNLTTPQPTAPAASPGAGRSWLVPVLLINSVLLLGLLTYLVLWPTAPDLPPRAEREAITEAPAAEPPQSPPVSAGGETELPEAKDETELPEAKAVTMSKPPSPAGAVEPAASPPAFTAPEPATLLPPSPTGPTPRLSELPTEWRRQIAAPTLEVHVYSESPARRFVMIGGRQYQEGDRLPGELHLEEITPQGVELSHHGRRFRLDR